MCSSPRLQKIGIESRTIWMWPGRYFTDVSIIDLEVALTDYTLYCGWGLFHQSKASELNSMILVMITSGM